MPNLSLSELTRLSIVTEVANIIGRDLNGLSRDGTTTLKTRLNEAFEAAQMRLARAYSWPELDTYDRTTGDTIASQKSYTFGAFFGSNRIKQILALIVEDGLNSRKLFYKTNNYVMKYYPDPDSSTTQKPIIYTTVGENVHLIPVPDVAYDMTSIVSPYPTRATGDTFKSDFRRKDDILIALTTVEAYQMLEEFDAMREWERISVRKIVEAVRPILSPDDFEPEGRAFMTDPILSKEYWKDPLATQNP